MRYIEIYSDLESGVIRFDGSTVNPKPLGSCVATTSLVDATRILIKSVFPNPDGTDRRYMSKLNPLRVKNKNGVKLVETLGYTTQQVMDYLNVEFTRTLSELDAEYKGVWNASTNTPDVTADADAVAGDWYFVTTAGTYDTIAYGVNDQIRYSGTNWERIADVSVKVSDIENAALSEYDQYVDPNFVGTSTGSTLKPWTTILDAVNNSTNGESISVKGVNVVSSEIVLAHGLSFYGAQHSEIKFNTYSASNGSIFSYDGDSTKEFEFFNIKFSNAGEYALHTKKTTKVTIDKCTFINNGWNGSALNTIASKDVTGVLGYDSDAADLQAFYASNNASNGGAVRIEESTQVLITGNTITNNLRGLRVQDCGINGGGVISRNQSTQNIESGIYIAAGSLGGSQNITTTMNVSAYNANNGLLVIGGLNNKFSQNEVNGNWNAGFCAWGAGNTTLRDCGLYDNNRSEYNGIGNTGDAKASIQINEAYNLLGTSISLNPAFRFIAEILDTQVHYTGLGSNTDKIGFLITEDVGLLADNDKNIIKIDDVGFIGQDYAIDLSEVNVGNLRLSLGDNSYQSIAYKAIKAPLLGNYSELPFSNHVMQVPSVDIVVDTLKQMISLTEGVGGNVINVYNANELQSVINGGKIDVIQKGSDKIQLRGNALGSVYINGVVAGSNLATMNDSVNAAFNMSLIEYKSFLESEVGVTGENVVHYVIESPDGNFEYPLFKTSTEANAFDNDNGGTGTSSTITYVDDLTNTTWYYPTNLFVDNGTSMPVDGVYGNSTNVVWNVQVTEVDGNYTPDFTDVVYTVEEGEAVNIVYKPSGDTSTYNITNVPSGLADNGSAIIGTAETITDGVDVQRVINVTKANEFGSDTGTITLNITNDTSNDSLTTPWTKGLIMSGTNEYAFNNQASQSYNPVQMDRKGNNASIGAIGKTSNDVDARPWAVAQVVKIDSAYSIQNFWSQGESYSTVADAITFYKQGGNIKLFWGRSTSHIQAQFTAPANGWYGYYVEHGGYRENISNVTEANLNTTFRIKQVNLETGVVADISLAWNTGNLGDMTRQLDGSFMVGRAYPNLGNSGGGLKIASTVVTTLLRNQDKPTDIEISTMVRDPKQWLIDYKEGNDFRASANGTPTANFQVGLSNSTKGTSVWLMGDGVNDSFSNMIRNQVKTNDQNNTKLTMVNMQASDITNVSITGLS